MMKKLELLLAGIAVALAAVIVARNLVNSPQLLDWTVPVMFAVVTVIWMITRRPEGQQ